jgi:hypothetical protein
VYTKIKNHIEEHKLAYSCVATGIVVATFTSIIMRSVASRQSIRGGISVPAQGGISVLGKNNVLNNVSYISSNRTGPPSWVIRCLETGDLFTSQKSAALELEIPASEISKHLNGMMDNVRGYTFERICMAA